MHMKLSVIIPFYKYKNYLKECLQSLKDSTYQNFETILVLDNVEEEIDDLLAIYTSDLRLRVVKASGHGVAAARNTGLKEATGEYIYFLDSDDYVLEDTFELLANELQGQDVVAGKIAGTWNNKANYLEKRNNKLEELDESEIEQNLERRKAKREERIDRFLEKYNTIEKNRALSYYYLFVKKKGMLGVSAVGCAFKRTFIVEHQFDFDESLQYYSDFLFMVKALYQVSTFGVCLESYYVKRKHNDPINYPALRQESSDQRFFERMDTFKKARDEVSQDSMLRQFIDRKILNYYLHVFIKRLRRSEQPEWKKEYYPLLSKLIQGCSTEQVKRYGLERRAMIASIQRNDLKKTLKQVRFYLGRKKLKQMFKNKNVGYKLMYYHRYLKQPILPNVVLFETFNAKNYSDSPKYIYEYLAKHYGDQFTCVWALNNGTQPPYGAKVVKRFSFKYAYYLARSKYLVFNVRPPLWYRKREGQIFLETWHGTPLKRLVFDQEEVTAASPKYKQQFFKQRKDWDYLISANDFSTETLARCFMYEGEMLDYGYPRNDLMYAENKDELAKSIREKLQIPLDKKTILYAPTWRDDEYYGKGKYKFTLKLDLPLLQKQLGDEYVILLRTHQYIADSLDISGLEGFAYNVSKYDDITELYLISDLCITDYSSVFFDYANLRRPILFYTYDIEKYKNQLRGFYIDMNTEVPGPLLYTSEEVIDAIQHIDDVTRDYAARYDEFYNRFCHIDDGHASKRVVERVFFDKKG